MARIRRDVATSGELRGRHIEPAEDKEVLLLRAASKALADVGATAEDATSAFTTIGAAVNESYAVVGSRLAAAAKNLQRKMR